MEKFAHTLKSNPEKTVQVPAEYASKAEGLVKLSVESQKPSDLFKKFDEYPCLRNAAIMVRAAKLTQSDKTTPESLRLQDEVYLRACINWLEQIDGEEWEEAETLCQSLIHTVESLYYN